MQPAPAQPDHRKGNEGQWVFWLLFGLAAVGFAPCILLPAWRDYQAAVVVEQIQAGEVERLESELERQRQLADALRSEPSVIARAAQRELEYTRPGEIRVDVDPAPATDRVPVLTSNPLEPPEPPALIRRALAWLPPLNYDAVFCHPPTRMVIMVMSGGVLLAAFALFPPGREGAEPSTSKP